ncbi:MAG TPA: tetratricopeptide repeat protein, partial [Puia sp.]|nr:tetratricopeptide repeat protein [Puia sp.]
MLRKYLTIPLIFICVAWKAFSQPDPALSSRLSALRGNDDLSGWIYAQIQWTARAPSRRSDQLVRAVRQAWRRPQSPEEEQAWLDLLTNEGYSLLLSGSIVPSTDAYSAAYDFARNHTAIADAGLVLETVLKPLGNNYIRLGDYEQALYIHQKAAALALALGDHDALAGEYSNLANTCGNMGRTMAARDYCRKGLAVARPRSAMAGLLFSELADTYREMGMTDSAKQAIRQSIGILRSAHDHPSAAFWLLMAYQSAGDLYGVTKQALEFYEQGLTLQWRLALAPGEERQRDRAKLYWRLGALFGELGQKAEAVRWLDSCLAVLLPGRSMAALRVSDVYAENTLADALYALAGLQSDPDEAIRFYELSFATERKGRQQLITTSSKERWVADSRSRYEAALQLAWNAWNRTGQRKYASAMLRFMESSKAQLLLDEILQQQQLRMGKEDSTGSRIRLLERAKAYYQKEMIGGRDSVVLSRLRETDWQLAHLRKMDAVADAPEVLCDDLWRSIPSGMVTRSYFAGQKVLYTIECGREGIRYVDRIELSAGWQDSVRAFIHRWFGSGPNHMIDDPAAYYREASKMYQRFFGGRPLDAGFAYMLLPDGALSLLPVEALIAQGASAGGTQSTAQ